MPVTFYPPKPIELLDKYIIKEDGTPLRGEIDIYCLIHDRCSNSKKQWYVWHDLSLPFHSDSFNPKRKTNSQIDFLLLCDDGILVLEVKGGPISCKNQTFYYGNEYQEPMTESPFNQAKGYQYTIMDRITRSKDIFVCHAVAFPHSSKDFSSNTIDNNILWSRATSSKYNDCFETFLSYVFDYSRNKMTIKGRVFDVLSEHQITRVIKALNPEVSDRNKYYNANTEEWLNVANLEILESLYKNDRIMIEGGPGTGKTTFALAYIDKQIGKKGLYICWNNLLRSKIEYQLNQRGKKSQCDVMTLSQFILSRSNSLLVSDLLSKSEKDFSLILGKCIAEMKAKGILTYYDYIIIDEGQDVLDRGIDRMIDELTSLNGRGLNNGMSLIFYDLEQGFFNEGRDILDMATLMIPYYAHFKLNENKRSCQTPLIKVLANSLTLLENDALVNSFRSWRERQGVNIYYASSFKMIKSYLVKEVLGQLRNKQNSLKGSDCILLIESSIIKMTDDEGLKLTDYHLLFADVEELTPDNINDTGNILRYTSILKFKGLERQNVFLIINEPNDFNKYELYIGITRAISNLQIIIYDPAL